MNLEETIYRRPKDEFMDGACSLVDHAKGKLLYNGLAPIYHLAVSRNTERECRFINSVIKQHDRDAIRILDLGCGVGRHTGMLYKMYGYLATGVDISTSCLTLARKKYPYCQFVVSDIRNVRLATPFDVAICMWSTFNYLSTAEDRSGFFSSANLSLMERGLLIIDMNNYSIENCSTYEREAADKNYRVKMKICKEVKAGINEAIYHYEITDLNTGQVTLALDQELAKVFSADEVEAMASPWFSVLTCYGDYDTATEFEPSKSERIILVLRKNIQ